MMNENRKTSRSRAMFLNCFERKMLL